MTAKTSATKPSGTGVSLPERLLDLLFPPRCVNCGASGAPLCVACVRDIREPSAPRCARCDRSLLGAAGPHCQRCVALLRAATPPTVERIVVAADYEGVAGAAIRALKFRRQRRVAQPLALLLIEAARRAELSADIIIPMPLHVGRRLERGYNQATLLAQPLARALNAPLREDLLKRTRATRPQTRLSRRDRLANVAGAFALTSPAAATLLAGRRLVLVDDVTTTGATLEAAARALWVARPTAICALAVAHPVRVSDGLADDVPLDV